MTPMTVFCSDVPQRSPEDAAIRELAPEFRPPEWLTDVISRTTPYFPQIGDEVIYFVQGHQQYVEAVKNRDVYRIDVDRNQPWHKMPHIRVCSGFLSDFLSVKTACTICSLSSKNVFEVHGVTNRYWGWVYCSGCFAVMNCLLSKDTVLHVVL